MPMRKIKEMLAIQDYGNTYALHKCTLILFTSSEMCQSSVEENVITVNLNLIFDSSPSMLLSVISCITATGAHTTCTHSWFDSLFVIFILEINR